MSDGSFHKGNHNLDWKFNICFKDKCDERDMRPMIYPGRFVFPSPLGHPSKNMWFPCRLRLESKTADVTQLSPKKMKEPEDLSADALPPSTDLRENHFHGANRYSQIGHCAAEALCDALFVGPDLSSVPAVCIIDLWPKCGDFFTAFCNKRQMHSGTSIFYYGLCESQVELDWLHKTMLDEIAEKYEKGDSTLPGNDMLAKEIKDRQ